MASNALLEVDQLKVAYGGIQAVKGVSFKVHAGESVSLIGSNGAGKTTTMKAITGLLKPKSGDVRYGGQSIIGQGAWDLVQQGLAMVPANCLRRSLRRGKVSKTRSMSWAMSASLRM